MAFDKNNRHYLQWFVLCELQGYANMADFLDKKIQLYDFARKYSHPAVYYMVELLEDVRKDPQSGTVYFSDNIKRVHVQNSRPSGSPHLQLLVNLNYKPPKHPLEDFRI